MRKLNNKFVRGTKFFFEKINNIRKNDEKSELTFELLDDPSYEKDDGSVINFRIKECQGWLFGVWWSEKENNLVHGHFFTQYESIINKFKPSASELENEFDINIQKEGFFTDYQIAQIHGMINFIIEEPALAFCRDYLGWDYNLTFRTREEAQFELDKYTSWHKTKTQKINELNKEFLIFVEKNILPKFNEAEIVDLGNYCSPRYDVVAPFSKNKVLVKKSGWYSWYNWNNDEVVEEEKEICKAFDILVEKAEKISDEYKFIYSIPFHENIGFLKTRQLRAFKTIVSAEEE